MVNNKGIVFDIQRLSLHNGDGLRTSVFLKGCPLDCIWCHNPESKKRDPELFFKPEKCIGCRRCSNICDLHTISNQQHFFYRDKCTGCLRCTEVCPAGALERVGKEMTVEEVMQIVNRDKLFFDTSNGGVTITGGEPLFQADFAITLAKACKEDGISVNIDTSGYASRKTVETIAEYTDTFLFDIKETDPERHRQFTGVDNNLILENLRLLDQSGKKTLLRCPIIPGYNDRDEHLREIGRLSASFTNIREITIIPYHPLGHQKAGWLNCEDTMPVLEFPKPEDIERWVSIISTTTEVPVCSA